MMVKEECYSRADQQLETCCSMFLFVMIKTNEFLSVLDADSYYFIACNQLLCATAGIVDIEKDTVIIDIWHSAVIFHLQSLLHTLLFHKNIPPLCTNNNHFFDLNMLSNCRRDESKSLVGICLF